MALASEARDPCRACRGGTGTVKGSTRSTSCHRASRSSVPEACRASTSERRNVEAVRASRPAASSTAFPQVASFQSAKVAGSPGAGRSRPNRGSVKCSAKKNHHAVSVVAAKRPHLVGAQRVEAHQQHVGFEPGHEVWLDLGAGSSSPDRAAFFVFAAVTSIPGYRRTRSPLTTRTRGDATVTRASHRAFERRAWLRVKQILEQSY